MNLPEIKNSEFVVFKSKNAQTEFQVILDGERDTVWATEQQIMDLFGKARRTIGEHIKNIYEEGELDKEATWREFRQVQKEGEREVSRKVSIYNLDVIQQSKNKQRNCFILLSKVIRSAMEINALGHLFLFGFLNKTNIT